MWIDAEQRQPEGNDEVLVTDGYSYAVAWFRASDETWHAETDMLDAKIMMAGAQFALVKRSSFGNQ